jgi:hypothetical protein
MPPISRLEDRAHTRKCVRLRRALKASYANVLDTYNQVSTVIKGFSEQTDLEKYLDIYEISDFDISDAGRGFNEDEFDDVESLRTLKIVACRFHTVRRLFLCILLALDATGESQDLLRWTTAVEALRKLNGCTKEAYNKLSNILSEEECKKHTATVYCLTTQLANHYGSISSTSIYNHSQEPFDTWARALALAASQAELVRLWHSGFTGQATATTRRIGQSPQ